MSSITPFDFQASTNIDEHNQIVDKVNEIVDVVNTLNLDGLGERLNTDEADISQLKISDQEHTSQIETIDGTLDTHAREINALKTSTSSLSSDLRAMSTAITEIKTKDQTQDTEISGLAESVVSDLVASFDNSTRVLSLSIERESATSIDAQVTIPGGGGSGGAYTAGAGIDISDADVISIDQSTRNEIGQCIKAVGIGADLKSLTFTHVQGQIDTVPVPTPLRTDLVTSMADLLGLPVNTLVSGDSITINQSSGTNLEITNFSGQIVTADTGVLRLNGTAAAISASGTGAFQLNGVVSFVLRIQIEELGEANLYAIGPDSTSAVVFKTTFWDRPSMTMTFTSTRYTKFQ